MSKGYVKAIQHRIAANIKYFERHGIISDKMDYIAQSLDPKEIQGAWNSKELQGLSYDEKVKRIASLATFPTEMSVLQAEKMVDAANALGLNLSFADVLKGGFDWGQLNEKEKILTAQALARGLSEKEAKKSARIAISQAYFGSL